MDGRLVRSEDLTPAHLLPRATTFRASLLVSFNDQEESIDYTWLGPCVSVFATDLMEYVGGGWDAGVVSSVAIYNHQTQGWLTVGEYDAADSDGGLVYHIHLEDNIEPVVGGSDDILTIVAYMVHRPGYVH
jgi:hypothetical protein